MIVLLKMIAYSEFFCFVEMLVMRCFRDLCWNMLYCLTIVIFFSCFVVYASSFGFQESAQYYEITIKNANSLLEDDFEELNYETLILCKKNLDQDCYPVFWTEDGLPLPLDLSFDKIGDQSDFVKDMDKALNDMKNFVLWSKPSLYGSFLGRTTGQIPMLSYDYKDSPQKISYYILNDLDIVLLQNSPTSLFDVSKESNLTLEIDELLPMMHIIATLISYYQLAQDDHSIDKICVSATEAVKISQDSKNLVCSHLEEQYEKVWYQWKESLQENVALLISALDTSSAELSTEDVTAKKDMSSVAVLNGMNYKDAVLSQGASTSCDDQKLSPYAEDQELYAVEGYFNCLFHGGGRACMQKYSCDLQPKNQKTCDLIADNLYQVKLQLKYNDNIFVDKAYQYCNASVQ